MKAGRWVAHATTPRSSRPVDAGGGGGMGGRGAQHEEGDFCQTTYLRQDSKASPFHRDIKCNS